MMKNKSIIPLYFSVQPIIYEIKLLFILIYYADKNYFHQIL